MRRWRNQRPAHKVRVYKVPVIALAVWLGGTAIFGGE